MFRRGPDNIYRSSLLENVAWLRHGFGTRNPSGWLDVEPLTAVRQFHSDQVVIATDARGFIGEGDSLITNYPSAFLSIRTADCFPILIADMRNRAVAAVHAGWRGTVSEIAAKTIISMEREYGSKPAHLCAAIGPGIGPCCFEVGREVAVQFGTIFPEQENLHARINLDLVEANHRQLLQSGVPVEHIDAARICTCCGGDLFHSFRRDRQAAGRMTSAIGIEAWSSAFKTKARD